MTNAALASYGARSVCHNSKNECVIQMTRGSAVLVIIWGYHSVLIVGHEDGIEVFDDRLRLIDSIPAAHPVTGLIWGGVQLFWPAPRHGAHYSS